MAKEEVSQVSESCTETISSCWEDGQRLSPLRLATPVQVLQVPSHSPPTLVWSPS
jgi:hypothetical protein